MMIQKLYTFIMHEISDDTLRTRHYVGSPSALTGETAIQQDLPSPRILSIEEMGNGVFLTRYDRTGAFAGDTWHISIKDAKEQAHFEFDTPLTEWRNVPDDAEDFLPYILHRYSAGRH